MDERFIKWLNLYDEFSEGTVLRDIMDDAIRCYRHGIARPALMLSYIAFIQAVRNNLLNSEIPKGFNEPRWNACMNKLRQENAWDEQVITCIKNRDKPTYFELTDSLRDDVCYWRNRRNDCAHYKDSEITLSHVSAFWVFIMDNYNKFAPLGSIEQSINDYKRHYDVSLTPVGASTNKIFKRLCLALKTEEELKKFLQDTNSMMGNANQNLLLHKLLLENNHRQKVISFLKRNLKRVRFYLSFFPSDVSLVLGDDAELIRKYWYDGLQLSPHSIPVYAEMLRAKMIPKAEVNESLSLLLRNEFRTGSFRVAEEKDFKTLLDNGLYDIFIKEYLTIENICHDPSEKCHKTDFYIPIIQMGGVTDQLITTLADAFTGRFPYTLSARLKAEIFSDEENRKKYKEAIARLGLNDFLDLKD